MQARHAGRARDAAEPEHRHPPDVWPQADPGGDAGVERRHRETGDGRRIDDVDVRRLETGVLECAKHRCAAELDGMLDEDVVGLAEVVQRGVLLQ